MREYNLRKIVNYESDKCTKPGVYQYIMGVSIQAEGLTVDRAVTPFESDTTRLV